MIILLIIYIIGSILCLGLIYWLMENEETVSVLDLIIIIGLGLLSWIGIIIIIQNTPRFFEKLNNIIIWRKGQNKNK